MLANIWLTSYSDAPAPWKNVMIESAPPSSSAAPAAINTPTLDLHRAGERHPHNSLLEDGMTVVIANPM